MTKYIAIDLGAESGRVIVGGVENIEVIHRFANQPVRVGDSIYWDIFNTFVEIKSGLKASFNGIRKESVVLVWTPEE